MKIKDRERSGNIRISKRCAFKISWPDVCTIVAQEIEEILGIYMQCKPYKEANYYWNIEFVDKRLTLSNLHQLLQTVQATPEDLEDSLPNKDVVDVPDIGMVLSKKLLSRYLNCTWERTLITTDSLWLVGVKKNTNLEDGGSL